VRWFDYIVCWILLRIIGGKPRVDEKKFKRGPFNSTEE
jgi:hypothetical protein